MRKRVVSIVLFVCLFCSTFPLSAMAADNPFTDVNQNDYCYEAVMWAYENGITAGTSATTFSPSATCTRSQVVTFLWRANGCPAPKSKNNPFTDVKEGSWYYEPVLWAVEEGITYGTSATTFSPNQTCTNGQIITLIWRVIDGEEVPDELKANWGVGNTWYSSAAVWGYATAVLGEETPSYSMESPCPRANIVTYLYRADQNWGNQADNPDDTLVQTIDDETKYILAAHCLQNVYEQARIPSTVNIERAYFIADNGAGYPTVRLECSGINAKGTLGVLYGSALMVTPEKYANNSYSYADKIYHYNNSYYIVCTTHNSKPVLSYDGYEALDATKVIVANYNLGFN